MQISDLLTTTQRNKASDLHISSGKPPSLRLNGDIIKIEGAPVLSAEDAKNLLDDGYKDMLEGRFNIARNKFEECFVHSKLYSN